VRTLGEPVSAEAARRGLEEARSRLRSNQDFRRGRSQCPAAVVLSATPGREMTLRCGVEGTIITADGDPMSVASFCCGDHTACPSWRAEREANWAGRRLRVA
jgi:hypothetical protein